MRIHPSCLSSAASFARASAGAAAGFRGIACLLALALFLGLPRPAMAAGDDAEPAQMHLRRAAAAFDLGNYADAAREYEAAYMKAWDPKLLVSVGQTWQLAGDRQKALTAFRSYLRVAPGGEQRALCEAKIRELEGQPTSPAMAAPLPGAMGPPMMAVPPPSAPPPLPTPAPAVLMPVAAPSSPPPYAVPPPAATTFAASEARAPVAAESPVYHRWPFWIVVGTVVVAGAAVAIWYTTDKDLAMPITTFGTKDF
jgi:tetratricopeptide (TPR) repeat protein